MSDMPDISDSYYKYEANLSIPMHEITWQECSTEYSEALSFFFFPLSFHNFH